MVTSSFRLSLISHHIAPASRHMLSQDFCEHSFIPACQNPACQNPICLYSSPLLDPNVFLNPALMAPMQGNSNATLSYTQPWTICKVIIRALLPAALQ